MKIMELDKDGTFVLPRFEAMQVKEGKELTILFKFETAKVDGHDSIFRFYYHTEANFPTVFISKQNSQSFKEAIFDKKEEQFNDGSTRKIILNACRMWNYLGDATHCSELIPTPYFLIKGQQIVIQNKFNVPKIKSVVSNIDLVRDNDLNWFWKISIKKSI